MPISPVQIFWVTVEPTAPVTVGSWANLLFIVNIANGLQIDTAYLVTRQAPFDWRETGPVAVLSSAWSGIQVEVYSDQEAYQVYSCGGQNGSLTLKETQGLFNVSDRPRTVQQYGCVVMEVEDWIDGINQPEWGRSQKQIFGPDTDPYVLQASLHFSLLGQESAAPDGTGESPGLAGGQGTETSEAASASSGITVTTSVGVKSTVSMVMGLALLFAGLLVVA